MLATTPWTKFLYTPSSAFTLVLLQVKFIRLFGPSPHHCSSIHQRLSHSYLASRASDSQVSSVFVQKQNINRSRYYQLSYKTSSTTDIAVKNSLKEEIDSTFFLSPNINLFASSPSNRQSTIDPCGGCHSCVLLDWQMAS